MLVVLAVLRWIPPARARSVAAFCGVIIGGGTFVGVQLLLSRSVRAGLAISPPTVPAWLPLSWPARALAETGLGHPVAALAYLVASVVLAGLLALASVV